MSREIIKLHDELLFYFNSQFHKYAAEEVIVLNL